MLEAIIDLRRNNETGKIGDKNTDTKQVGDIICVKKSPAVWGKKEKEDFLIVKLKDDALEADMKTGLKIYPYAVMEDGEVINRSKLKIDHTEFIGTDSLDTKKETGAVSPRGKDSFEIKDLPVDEAPRVLTDNTK